MLSSSVSVDVTLQIPFDQLAVIQQQPALSLRHSGEMYMPQLPFPIEGGPALKLWQPTDHLGAQDQSGEHRIANPVLPPSAVFSQMALDNQSGPKKVQAAEIERVRQEMTLPEFYSEFMAPWRSRQLVLKKVKAGTLGKERQALNRWTAWEREMKPADWPIGMKWKGCPIGYLAGGYLDQFYAWLATRYAKDSVIGTRNHIRTVLNFAVDVAALIVAPQPEPLNLEDPEDVDEDLATVWTEAEIDALYFAMEKHADIQAAFVLDVCCGPRSVDLFGLRWDKNIRLEETPPRLRFRATKTGKKHGIALPSVAVAHLARLRKDQFFQPTGMVFPKLTSAVCKDPERSKAARRRTAKMKAIMAEAGLPEHERPWQVCRATCCTRLNTHKRGVGSWVIGQGRERSTTKVAADFYDNPTEEMIAALLSAPQPKSFQSILG